MSDEAIVKAAAYLTQCRLSGDLVDVLPVATPLDARMAYRVQEQVHAGLKAALGPVTGHKIGCTTPIMQRYLAISQPCAGGIFASTVLMQGGRFPASRRGRLGVECEIAVRLGADLAGAGSAYTRDNVAPAVQAVMAAIEIVEDRYRDYASLGAPSLIADDFFNSGCVLGKPLTDWRNTDLGAVRGRMWVNGELRGQGLGADILGHPLQALAWLASHRESLGSPLRAGEFVLLGSVVQTQWLQAGDRVRIDIDGLGGAELTVEPGV